jgi:hypothetical protein
MNIRVIAICLMLVSAPGLAQKRDGDMGAQRAAMLETLARGKEFSVNSERYQHLPEVFSVERWAGRASREQALSQVGASAASVIETKGRHVIFRRADRQPAAVAEIGGAEVYPTVLNVRTGTIGILLGTLVVQPKSMAEANAIASSHGLEVARAFPHLKTVFYRVRRNADVIDAALLLRADTRIASAYPEILEHVQVPH